MIIPNCGSLLVPSILSWLVILVVPSCPHVEVRTESRRNLAPSAASRLGQGPKCTGGNHIIANIRIVRACRSIWEHLTYVKLYKRVFKLVC